MKEKVSLKTREARRTIIMGTGHWPCLGPWASPPWWAALSSEAGRALETSSPTTSLQMGKLRPRERSNMPRVAQSVRGDKGSRTQVWWGLSQSCQCHGFVS